MRGNKVSQAIERIRTNRVVTLGVCELAARALQQRLRFVIYGQSGRVRVERSEVSLALSGQHCVGADCEPGDDGKDRYRHQAAAPLRRYVFAEEMVKNSFARRRCPESERKDGKALKRQHVHPVSLSRRS